LMIANALVAFSGAVLAQYQGFADIGMGTGTIVIGLASIIIGETLFRRKIRIMGTMIAIIGSLLYRGIIALSLMIGLNASDLKWMTSMIVILVLCLQHYKKRRR
ncbi:ABC transporter permease, partial [Bacteroides pyogenes]